MLYVSLSIERKLLSALCVLRHGVRYAVGRPPQPIPPEELTRLVAMYDRSGRHTPRQPVRRRRDRGGPPASTESTSAPSGVEDRVSPLELETAFSSSTEQLADLLLYGEDSHEAAAVRTNCTAAPRPAGCETSDTKICRRSGYVGPRPTCQTARTPHHCDAVDASTIEAEPRQRLLKFVVMFRMLVRCRQLLPGRDQPTNTERAVQAVPTTAESAAIV